MHYLNQPLDLTFGFTSEETVLKGYLPKVIQIPTGGSRQNHLFMTPKSILSFIVYFLHWKG